MKVEMPSPWRDVAITEMSVFSQLFLKKIQVIVPEGRRRHFSVVGEIYVFFLPSAGLLGSTVPCALDVYTHRRYAALRAGDRSVLLVSYWTREAIGNARHSRPRPPSHIRNLKTQRRPDILIIPWHFYLLIYYQSLWFLLGWTAPHFSMYSGYLHWS